MDTIISLLNQVANEEIVLPAIQRDFVWPEEKISTLLDSVLRGYPIGLVLLWETYEDIQYRPFVKNYRSVSPHAFRENPEQRRMKVVLDGQQRLQSLYVALYGTYEQRSLWFDLLSGVEDDDLSDQRYVLDFFTAQEAAVLNARGEPTGFPTHLYVKTSRLFNMSAQERREFQRERVSTLNLDAEEADLLEDNLLRFDDGMTKDPNIVKAATIDENLTSHHPSRKSEADVTEIFVRVNALGTDLSRSDLIFSMLKLNWRESAEALPEFVRTVNLGNDFGISTDFVIRCLFAVSDLGAKMDLNLLRKKSNIEALQRNFVACCDAIRSTVDFVVTRCGCRNAALVGGLNSLVPIVYYLFRLPHHEVPNSEVEKLKSAVYLFGFSKAFSRYGEGRIANFIRGELRPLADGGSKEFPYSRAAQQVSAWQRQAPFDLSFVANNVLLALHLIQRGAGDRVQYANNSPEIDHIFPRKTLRDMKFPVTESTPVQRWKACPTCPRILPLCFAVDATCHRMAIRGASRSRRPYPKPGRPEAMRTTPRPNTNRVLHAPRCGGRQLTEAAKVTHGLANGMGCE